MLMMIRTAALPLGCVLVLCGFAIVASASSLASGLAGEASMTQVIGAGSATLFLGAMLVLMDQRP